MQMLLNRSGDADLYVSQTTNKPTYEPEHYCLQSTTCGQDSIVIPKRYTQQLSLADYL